MMDAFRRSSAARITAVIPYYGYARQDRKDKPRVPISAKLVANLIVAAGADRVLTMDLHKAQIQAFFDIPTDHLFAAPVIIDYLSRQQFGKVTIVSPDAGGAERARAYAKRLGADLAIIDKRRSSETGAAEVMNVIGEIRGRICILQDDIIDTAGTIVKAAQALADGGAERIIACAVHGVLSPPAIDRINSLADRAADRDQHDPARRRARPLSQAARPVGGAAARAGDSEHPRGDVGLLAVRVSPRSPSKRPGFQETQERERRHGLSHPRSNHPRVPRQERSPAPARRPAGSRRSSTAAPAAPSPLSVDPKALSRILHSGSGVNSIIGLDVPGQGVTQVLVKEFLLEPIKHSMLHADFYRLQMDKAITVTVSISLKGEPKGVKLQGGVVDFPHREVEVECLPGDIPEHLTIDVSRADDRPGRPPEGSGDRRQVDAGERSRHADRPRHRGEGRRGRRRKPRRQRPSPR